MGVIFVASAVLAGGCFDTGEVGETDSDAAADGANGEDTRVNGDAEPGSDAAGEDSGRDGSVPDDSGSDGCSTKTTWYPDCDGDGVAAKTDGSRMSCSAPAEAPERCSGSSAGWSDTDPTASGNSKDCDDGDEAVHPGATEMCDDKDNDCDGYVDGFGAGCPKAALFGSSKSEIVYDMAVGGSDTIAVAGGTTGALDGEGNKGGNDAFVALLDRDGTVANAETVGSSDLDLGEAVAVDDEGNVYLGGRISGAVENETYEGSTDAFLAKYDSSGSREWVRLLGTPQSERVSGVTIGPFGSIYLAGRTRGDLGGYTNPGKATGFIAKFNSNGDEDLVRLFGTSESEKVRDIAAGEEGLYVVGNTSGEFDGQSPVGPPDAYVARFSLQLVLEWGKLIGSSAPDRGRAVAVDPDGRIHVVGVVRGSVEGNNYEGGDDAFWALFGPDGDRKQIRFIQSSGGESLEAIAFGSEGHLRLAGVYDAPVLDLNHVGQNDGFVAKYQYDEDDFQRQWAVRLVSPSNEKIAGLGFLSDGHLVAAGSTSGNLQGMSSIGKNDGFLAW